MDTNIEEAFGSYYTRYKLAIIRADMLENIQHTNHWYTIRFQQTRPKYLKFTIKYPLKKTTIITISTNQATK